MVPMQEIVDRGIDACTNEIFDIAWKGTNGIYWSWDTDSLDASCMPGTTAPKPLGSKPRDFGTGPNCWNIRGRYI